MTRRRNTRRHGSNERGSVLLMALLVTMLVLGVGITAMWIASSGSKISANLTGRQEALYAAETGIDRAKAILSRNLSWDGALDGSYCASPPPPYDPDKGMILCDGTDSTTGPLLQNQRVIDPSAANTNAALTAQQQQFIAGRLIYTVWIRNDPLEYAYCDTIVDPPESSDNGDCNFIGGVNDLIDQNMRKFNDNDRRVVIRAEGVARDGRSRVAVETTVGREPLSGRACYMQAGGCNGQGSNSYHGANL